MTRKMIAHSRIFVFILCFMFALSVHSALDDPMSPVPSPSVGEDSFTVHNFLEQIEACRNMDELDIVFSTIFAQQAPLAAIAKEKWVKKLQSYIHNHFDQIKREYPTIRGGSFKVIYLMNPDGSKLESLSRRGIALLVPIAHNAMAVRMLHNEIDALKKISEAKIPTMPVIGKKPVFTLPGEHTVGALAEFIPDAMTLDAKRAPQGKIMLADAAIILNCILGKVVNTSEHGLIMLRARGVEQGLRAEMLRNAQENSELHELYLQRASALSKDFQKVQNYFDEGGTISDLQFLITPHSLPTGQGGALVHDPLAVIFPDDEPTENPEERHSLAMAKSWVTSLHNYVQKVVQQLSAL